MCNCTKIKDTRIMYDIVSKHLDLSAPESVDKLQWWDHNMPHFECMFSQMTQQDATFTDAHQACESSGKAFYADASVSKE